MRSAARFASRFLNAYYNTGNYDFEHNGEAFALRTFAAHARRDAVIWDVGAHYGEYASAAHGIVPQAKVISFEILPPIAEQLRRRILGDWFEIKEMGLSDCVGNVDIVWNKRADTTNSIAPMMSEFFDHDQLETVNCAVATVDDLVASGTPSPDFLKIDVEGHEPAVLRGAQRLLSSDRAPLVIQFEYGMTWIGGGGLLHAAQTLLEGAGYKVGRLFPDHVEFKEFGWADEHFRMGNMIAVKDRTLLEAFR